MKDSFKTRKYIYILSGTFFTALVGIVRGNVMFYLINILLSIPVHILIANRTNILKVTNSYTTHEKVIGMIAACIISEFNTYRFFDYYDRVPTISNLLVKYNISKEAFTMCVYILCLGSIYACTVLLLYFINQVYSRLWSIFRELGKQYVKAIILTIVISIVILTVVYSITNIFYNPVDCYGSYIYYDVIYTTDTGAQFSIIDIYRSIGNSQNDWKQCLFGVFSLPIGLLSYILSKIFFVIPNAYFVFLSVFHMLMIDIIVILISDIMNLNKKSGLLFGSLFILTYPTLQNLFNLEQYIGTVFWLVVFIYMIIKQKDKVYLYLISAVGSMITNIIVYVFDIECWDKHEMISRLKLLVKTAGVYLGIVVIVGKLPDYLNLVSNIKNDMAYTGNAVPAVDKLKQYATFVESCIFSPRNITVQKVVEGSNIHSIQLDRINTFSLVGIIIFILSLLGILINIKTKFAKICGVWIIFSFILLGIIGWGAPENGMVLYSFYFSWAFICGIYMLISKLTSLLPSKVKIFVHIVIISVIGVYNIIGLIDIIMFGAKWYPCNWGIVL